MNLGIPINNAIRYFGDKRAISDDQREFSYLDLDDRTRRLGGALSAFGLPRGTRMASLQYNSIETFEIDIMSARFGFPRTLLNARSDYDDHLHAITHSGARVVFFGHGFEAHVEKLRKELPKVEHFICVGGSTAWADNYEELIAKTSPVACPEDIAGDDLHSIYYTSGTTGLPKGVALTQRNWLTVIRNHLSDIFQSCGPTDVLLHASPMSHASGAFALTHFLRGAEQFVLPRFEPSLVLDAIERKRVTTMFMAPTMIIMLMEQEGLDSRDLSSLRTVVYGGAAMAVDRIKEAYERIGPVLVQVWGQWEAPQIVTYLDQQDHIDAMAGKNTHRLLSAGKSFTFIETGVMDDDGNLLAPNQEGEIVTAGDHLMLGYLDQSDETIALREGRWQRSGDVGYIDTDGYMYLTDRKKDMIISGGNNVYPRQIEETLYEHPQVLEVVVIGIPSARWGEVIHAIVQPRKNQNISESEFLEWCRSRLATDKRPRTVSLVDDLPRSSYGKILRRELREPFWRDQKRKI